MKLPCMEVMKFFVVKRSFTACLACNVDQLIPLNLLRGVFHIRKLHVANLTKHEFSSKTLSSIST